MRGIELLHPDAMQKARQLQTLCAQKAIPLLITETLRTAAEQDALYAQGRTAAGKIVTNCKGAAYQSPHQWGVAFDFCRNIKGKEYDDSDGFFTKVGQLGKSIGLFWGGDFKSFVDKPHLELPEYLPNNSTKTLIAKYGAPDKFKAAWSGEGAAAARPTLRKGSKGEDVKELQRLLGGLAVDGSFGQLTESAVKAFQSKNKLAADGICGPKTWAALL